MLTFPEEILEVSRRKCLRLNREVSASQEPGRFSATCSNGAWGGELKHPHLAQLPVRPYNTP